jgi:uncharacterized protein (DUF302 family)
MHAISKAVVLAALAMSLHLFPAVAQAEDSDLGRAITPQLTRAIFEQSMRITKVEEGIGFDEVVQSMKLRANARNFKLVAELPLSKQIEAMGGTSNRMEIFAFCDAMIAKQLVEYDLVFAGYLPCRIALVDDGKGNISIVTMNMDMMVAGMSHLPPHLLQLAKTVRDTINDIVDAGRIGDL